MDERNDRSLSLPIPHCPVKLLFETDEYDFYQIKQREGKKSGSRVKDNVGSGLREDGTNSVQSQDGSETESDNERLFISYLKNITKRNTPNTRKGGLSKSSSGNNIYRYTPQSSVQKVEGIKCIKEYSEKESGDESTPQVALQNSKSHDDNEQIPRQPYHIFEKHPDLPISKDLRREWIYHTPAEAFVPMKVRLNNFQEECERVKRRLRGGADRLSTPDDPIIKQRKAEQYDPLIEALQSGIRSPNVGEIINHIVNHNCKNWKQKVDLEILRKEADNSKKERVLNRSKCFVDWLPKREKNAFSKYAIIAKLKRKTLSKTFKLVCDFNNSLLKGVYINQNLINTLYSEQAKRYFLESPSMYCLSSNDTFIISISFYHPIRGIKIAEYEILSWQTLADLTDVFFCFDSSNYGLPQFDGSVYYIDGVLYPDLRSPNALDYSACILDFYKKKKENNFIRPPYKVLQHKAVIGQMEIPLYQKCCFLHQGNCEHRIIFNNIRQYNSLRDKEFAKYPLRIFKPNIAKKFCLCCHKNIAQKIILDCYLFKENPSYICNSCFNLFLLDKEGNPVDAIMKHFEYIDEV
ncbi:snRNA-activating protein complex subunit 3, putative [Plasmodium knowlesi strain H]|uniref:snRNA-activating protein complex subunit 3, putative n=3 Tax=Plasmodium knowlesi TaxID=5850 RepID=A0A5K1UQY5_PLAKH|nr:snRNA-activating protein complex subunit 3, putative [Plasmodium knowlesi strain H]OTN65379.1 putative snRNA-activating protein complex subunit 3 [Plasmodium knowlesi]CAA9989537.1 snRNA-activating protein complex subunit 3, putative [Plasmodium knowlesi strain H]SBO22541.1 snRNA-activating protein complex subunit 3, putative [Plasmodium knowlesi strain H]SBO23596.1 snRNA-activating protein complex subunit 3, putative [Plasmodium knowlesi strain H]VVS79011.1 snRNA-activating protein complex |eukprot:XP_002260262.1 hypothetical protein, conserved in Plasmodium species [Plasmodium knowlesi strain H]